MTGDELRKKFLEYFHSQKNSHTIVNSSSLIPHNDETLLFTNAGMVQFKDVFLGVEKKPYTRAVSSQRCVRAGGKHNDLENVGYTARHHTFFEMLGNFSFGDYFKEEAIHYAWDFLTNVLKLPKEKLWVTVYQEDEESRKIWMNKIGLTPERVISCGEKDNFWSMGETGPCGPCTEIFYDHGESVWGGLPGTKDADGDRYIEIWNLVFMQFQRHADGALTPLPKPSVDTGMGLERISAVMQGVHNNYETDLFQPIIATAKKLTPPELASLQDQQGFHVLADHIRSTSFLICDGVMPSNEGRGYVLRRIIRRAVRHGYQMGMQSPFFEKLLEPLVTKMGGAYPELKKNQSLIQKTLEKEEMQFIRTLEQGMKILEEKMPDVEQCKIISGELAFKLYDTYGFPIDLTEDIAREKQLTVDRAGFEIEMEKQRKLSQSHQKFSLASVNTAQMAEGLREANLLPSQFTGYESLEESQAEITAVLENGILLNKTPFYAESGGQVGDKGVIESSLNTQEKVSFQVLDTQKMGEHIIHLGKFTSSAVFKVGDKVHAKVDESYRKAVMLNHTATHLLHAALRKILGQHVQQKGSLVAENKLRFDFSHDKAVSIAELEQIENLVNQVIRQNYLAQKTVTTPEQAIQSGAMALFGEKYGDKVRTLKLGDFSHELCGGTHVDKTGDIGLFVIISEAGIASGVRRIEALTGQSAIDHIHQQQKDLAALSALLKSPQDTLLDKLAALLEHQKDLQKQLDTVQSQFMRECLEKLLAEKKTVNQISVVSGILDNTEAKVLREACDYLKQKLPSGVIVLGSKQENKASLIVSVSKDIIQKNKEHYSANQLIKSGAEKIGGKGGGREELAQAGGDKPENLVLALKAVEACL